MDENFTVLDQVTLTLSDIGAAVERAFASDHDGLRDEDLDKALRRAGELVAHLEEWRGGIVLARAMALRDLTNAAGVWAKT